MKTPFAAVFSLAVLATLLISNAVGQMPRTLNYQGTLALGSTAVPDGNYNVTVRLYTVSSGGSAVWTEAQLVSTRNGVFNAILGKIVALPASFETPYWMSLQVGTDPELSPRLEMTGVSYSMQSAVSDSTVKLTNNSVTGAKIVNGTITGANVAPNTLTSANILDEPGVSSSYRGIVYLPVNTAIVIDSVDITLPAPGIVVITATGYLNLWHNLNEATRLEVSVSNLRADASFANPGAQVADVSSTLPADYYQFPYSSSRVYQESSAGAKRYYFNASMINGTNTTTNIEGTLITALYFPTLRGTLSKAALGSTILERSLDSSGAIPVNR